MIKEVKKEKWMKPMVVSSNPLAENTPTRPLNALALAHLATVMVQAVAHVAMGASM